MSTDSTSPSTGLSVDENRVRLPHGEAMSTTEANEVTRAAETSLVVIAGSPESGKTTFLASLLHLFQRGPFAGHYFGGSQTLVGFDRRCHLGRTRSRLPNPAMPRTNPGDPRRILHLRLRNNECRLKDVLLTDISGEDYEEVRHSVDVCREFALFSRADYIVLLVDGERLANNGERHAAKIEVLQMLRCMLDAGHLSENTWLDVLIAKCDLLGTDAAKSFAKKLLADVSTSYGERVAKLRCHMIAARPNVETDEFPLGFGMSEVFPVWLTRRNRCVDLKRRSYSENSETEFDRFLVRNSPKLALE